MAIRMNAPLQFRIEDLMEIEVLFEASNLQVNAIESDAEPIPRNDPKMDKNDKKNVASY